MTDKQIIIDGIDVSGCEHFNDSGNYNCRGCRWCKDNPNCHYKNWQRKEQECEELKEKCKKYGEINEQETKDYAKLKAERDELKKQACGLRPELKYIIDKTCCKYNINAKYYHEKIIEIINNLDKLKQTLAEIKPILEFYANSNMGEEQPDRTYKIMLSGGYIMVYDPKPARQALQKISECEGNDE